MILITSVDFAINRSGNPSRFNERMRDDAFARRFNDLVKEVGGPKTLHRLGPWLGVSPTMAWNYRTGEKIPGMENARQIAQRLNCCVEYLLTGRGPKRPGPVETELCERLARLTPTEQAAILAAVDSLLASRASTDLEPPPHHRTT